MTQELHELSLSEAIFLIKNKKISPVELLDAYLERITSVEDVVHSYVTIAEEFARKSAKVAEADILSGRAVGPLHGIPYGLKDNYLTRGVRSTAGSRLRESYVPDVDATAHTRLQQSGAILLGKLSTFEYGTGTGTDLFDLPFPPARNPWDPRCFTGGSSTGAGAGVAAGTLAFALGTDTTGSIRLPASACGLVGLKPTYGLVSRAGILPNCWTLDTAGPLTWTVEDCARVMQVIAGYDPQDPSSVNAPVPDFLSGLGNGVSGMRIGVVRRWHERDISCEPETAQAFDEAVRHFTALGATIFDVDMAVHVQDFRNCTRIINVAECYSIHEKDFAERRSEMGVGLRDKLTAGLGIKAIDYLRAQRWRRELTAAIRQALTGCDLLLSVTTMRRAPLFEDPAAVTAFTFESATAPFTVSGHPAVSVCSGFSADGLPLAIQITGHYFQEPTVLRAAAALERLVPGRSRRPDPLRFGRDLAIPPPVAAPAPAQEPDAARGLLAEAGLDVVDSEEGRVEHQFNGMKKSVAALPRLFPKSVEPMFSFSVNKDL